MSERASFLLRVEQAVRAGARYRPAPSAQLPESTGYFGAGPDPVARFCEELDKVGVHVWRVASADALHGAVRNVVRRYDVRRAIRGAARRCDELGIVDALVSAGVLVAGVNELAQLAARDRNDTMFAADLGLTAADWAIAETGTLVYVADADQTRGGTLLPPVHLTLVERSRVLADLYDLQPRLVDRSAGGVLPGNVAMVTGPSKTGDIELRLTTGVHGPGEVHVLMWDP